MKRFLLLTSLLLAAPALAGETYLGSIVSGAGADTTNATTASPFVIPFGTRLSVQCNATGYVIGDDDAAVTSTRGVTLAALALFLTKVDGVNRAGKTMSVAIAGQKQPSGILRIAGPAAVTCNVWARKGDE